jgi:hypothetical protein
MVKNRNKCTSDTSLSSGIYFDCQCHDDEKEIIYSLLWNIYVALEIKEYIIIWTSRDKKGSVAYRNKTNTLKQVTFIL